MVLHVTLKLIVRSDLLLAVPEGSVSAQREGWLGRSRRGRILSLEASWPTREIACCQHNSDGRDAAPYTQGRAGCPPPSPLRNHRDPQQGSTMVSSLNTHLSLLCVLQHGSVRRDFLLCQVQGRSLSSVTLWGCRELLCERKPPELRAMVVCGF